MQIKGLYIYRPFMAGNIYETRGWGGFVPSPGNCSGGYIIEGSVAEFFLFVCPGAQDELSFCHGPIFFFDDGFNFWLVEISSRYLISFAVFFSWNPYEFYARKLFCEFHCFTPKWNIERGGSPNLPFSRHLFDRHLIVTVKND